MTRKEKIIEKFLNMRRTVEDNYKHSSESEETKRLVEAIRTATNGTFIGEHCSSTLLGWRPIYDEQGRPLNANPNSKHSTITINGTVYPISRQGWYAYVYKAPKLASFATKYNFYNPTKHALLLAEVDLRPDYVKEYESEMKAKRPKHAHETRYDVVELDDTINLLTIQYRDGVKGNTRFSILPKSFADGLEDD